MQSQPNHIELICEKNTVLPIVQRAAMAFQVPVTSGRGYCSLSPRHDLARRFDDSGKEKLIVLMVSDHDPDGEEIAQSFARSLRDDFSITNLHVSKVALTRAQVKRFKLPAVMSAKQTSAQYGKFLDKHGTDDVYELEALKPDQLQQLIRDAIDSVIHVDLFNQEIDAEKNEASFLLAMREAAHSALGGINRPSGDGASEN